MNNLATVKLLMVAFKGVITPPPQVSYCSPQLLERYYIIYIHIYLSTLLLAPFYQHPPISTLLLAPSIITLLLVPSYQHPSISTLLLSPSYQHPPISTLLLAPSYQHPSISTLLLAPFYQHPSISTLLLAPFYQHPPIFSETLSTCSTASITCIIVQPHGPIEGRSGELCAAFLILLVMQWQKRADNTCTYIPQQTSGSRCPCQRGRLNSPPDSPTPVCVCVCVCVCVRVRVCVQGERERERERERGGGEISSIKCNFS